MNYSDLKKAFQRLKKNSPKDNLTAHIIFTENSFDEQYPLLSRTYRVSSDNKGFMPNMFSRSIFACCLDGTDQGVRLDWYMSAEGNSGGWEVQDCYILEKMQDVTTIPSLLRTEQDNGTVCCAFGDTCIQVREFHEGGKIRLEPVSGEQAACGEWTELPIDRVYGYCTLLTRHLNERMKS